MRRLRKWMFAGMVLLLLGVLTIWVSAATVAEGTCGADGDNLTWVLDDAGTLTISGEGAMKNYDSNSIGSSTAPWNDYRDEISEVVFADTVTSIGNSAFQSCSGLTQIVLPDSLSSIGDSAFNGCYGLTQIVLPDSLSSIGGAAFYDCSMLTKANFNGNAPEIGSDVFASTHEDFTIYYNPNTTGWSTPLWNGYPAYPMNSFEGSAKIVLSDTSVYRGETFTADIVLENAFPATALSVYDIIVSPDLAEVLSMEWLLPEGVITDIDPDTGTAVIAYDEAADRNGAVLRLTLQAAEVDEAAECTLVCSMALEVDEKRTEIAVTPGTVEIADYSDGDTNGDTKLTSADAIYLLRHTLLPDRYPLAGTWFDFNNDGTVNAKDAVYLLRHVLMPEKYPITRE